MTETEDGDLLWLYEVEIGGCAKYWVVAMNAYRAVRLVEECQEDLEHSDGITADLCPLNKAKEAQLRDDGCDAVCSMQEAYEKATSAQVLACSEWP